MEWCTWKCPQCNSLVHQSHSNLFTLTHIMTVMHVQYARTNITHDNTLPTLVASLIQDMWLGNTNIADQIYFKYDQICVNISQIGLFLVKYVSLWSNMSKYVDNIIHTSTWPSTWPSTLTTHLHIINTLTHLHPSSSTHTHHTNSHTLCNTQSPVK